MIRFSTPTRDRRVVIAENRSLGILEYGEDNKYPQNIEDQVDKSGTASVCVNQLTNFLSGEGFEAAGETIINSDGQTIDELLELASNDFAKFRGFAMHVSFNRLGEKTEYRHIDFSQVRLPIDPATTDYMVYMPNIGEGYKLENEDKTIRIPRYNPDKVQEQIEEAKRPDIAFMGQILWFSADGKFTYPLPVYGAVVEDMETEYNMMLSKNSSVKSGFSARHLMYYNDEFETDADFDEFTEGIRQYSGPEEQGSIIVLETKKKDMIELVKIEQSDNAEAMYKYVEESTHESIRSAFAIPPVLIGGSPNGTLGSSKEYIDSVATYNMITRSQRTTIAKQFSFIFDVVLSIQPLQFEDPAASVLTEQTPVEDELD